MAISSRYIPSGNGPFGKAPSPIEMPPSLYSQVIGAVPGAANLGGPAASAIGTEISGELNPNTVAQLQNKAAAFGVTSGMPGLTPGSLALNNLLATMGMTSEGLTQHGLGDYSNFLGTLAGTMTNPATTADVGEWNSIVKSAPDPASAAGYQQQLMQQYLSMLSGPAGGTGVFAGPVADPWLQGAVGAELPPGSSFYGGAYHTPAPAGA